MKPYIAVLVAAFALTGCMTMSSVEQRRPLFESDTAKPLEVYVNCVHEAWVELGGADVFRRQGSVRVRNIAGGILDVTATAGGARAVLREPPLSGFSFGQTARACL
ncbi:hypothetical protein WJ968_25010 [Achromobacter xylosoxidans]